MLRPLSLRPWVGRGLPLSVLRSPSSPALFQAQVRGYAINRKRNLFPSKKSNRSKKNDYYCQLEQEFKYYKLRKDDKIPIRSEAQTAKEIDVPYHVSSISKASWVCGSM